MEASGFIRVDELIFPAEIPEYPKEIYDKRLGQIRRGGITRTILIAKNKMILDGVLRCLIAMQLKIKTIRYELFDY